MTVDPGVDDLSHRLALAERLNAQRKLKNFTHATLAHRAGYDERTIRNLLKGRRTHEATLRSVCEALDINHAEVAQTAAVTADEQHGGYNVSHLKGYVGHYLSCRRNFISRKKLVCCGIDISWSNEKRCLAFTESRVIRASGTREIKYSHSGEIFIGFHIGLLHLLTVHEGAVRLTTLTHIREDKSLVGIVLTQYSRGASTFCPASSPIILKKFDNCEEVQERMGEMTANRPEYGMLISDLDAAERDLHGG